MFSLFFRLSVKYYYEAMQIKDDWSAAPRPQPVAPRMRQVPPPPSALIVDPKDACPVCHEKIEKIRMLEHLAESHFQDKVANLPRQMPFRCSLCPHCSPDYRNLLRHFGYFHKMFSVDAGDDIKMEEDLKQEPPTFDPENSLSQDELALPTPEDGMDIKEEPFEEQHQSDPSRNSATPASASSISSAAATTNSTSSSEPVNGTMSSSSNPDNTLLANSTTSSSTTQNNSISNATAVDENGGEDLGQSASSKIPPSSDQIAIKPMQPIKCLMCDDCKEIGVSNFELWRHLTDVHFKQRLSDVVQVVTQEETGKRMYRCPECGYEHVYKTNIAKHIGLKHRFARDYYNQAVGIKDEELPEQSSNAEPGPQNKLPPAVPPASSSSSSVPETPGASASPPSAPKPADPPATVVTPPPAPVRAPPPPEPVSLIECKICSVKSKGLTEYLKHLSKNHFKNKLMQSIPKQDPKCPVPGCEFDRKDRVSLAMHYGTFHKASLEIMKSLPPDALTYEDVEAKCRLCDEKFTAHRYLYTHLSDTHFQVSKQKLQTTFFH